MANHSWSNGDHMNHQNAYLGNSTTSPESSEIKHLPGIAMNWSSEEQAILEAALVRYPWEPSPSILRYAKIASELQHKTVRDVAMRCRWINKKRRQEDHNGRASTVDNKETIDMVVASNSAPRLLREEDACELQVHVACELQVHEPLFSLMKDGIKTVEARCFETEYDRLQQRGSLVMINKSLMFEVMKMHKFSSFYELLKAESLEKVFPGTKTVEEGMQMFKKWCDVGDQEKSNGVVAIHLSKSVSSQPCVALSHILSGLSYTGVQSLLGLSHTVGSISHALPPPRPVLLSSFMLPYKPKIKGCRLSHGARALSKHVDRSSDRFWGVLSGSDSDKNRLAMDTINSFIWHCCWMNVHIVPPHGEVFEIRVVQGYGARWSRDGTRFVGFLEPYTEDGHSMAWKH